MTTMYIGVKKVLAWEEERNGKAGYAVKYEDGYTSWSPADVFEKSYFRISDIEGNSLTESDITRFFDTVEAKKMGEKTTVTKATLINGFEMVDGSSCVEPKNYNEELGTKICVERIRDKVWMLLGFVLQWANKGIKSESNSFEL